jgi:hypothetical protein
MLGQRPHPADSGGGGGGGRRRGETGWSTFFHQDLQGDFDQAAAPCLLSALPPKEPTSTVKCEVVGVAVAAVRRPPMQDQGAAVSIVVVWLYVGASSLWRTRLWQDTVEGGGRRNGANIAAPRSCVTSQVIRRQNGAIRRDMPDFEVPPLCGAARFRTKV